MRRLLNQMKIQASLQNDFANPTLGIICSYDPDSYSCRVQLFPADPVTGEPAAISGWMPVSTIWIGNQWGLFCPPSIGDLVEIDFKDGDFEDGYCAWRYYTDDNRPVHAESGVFYIIHKSGSSLKFENNGKVTLNSASEIDLGNISSTLHTLVTDLFKDLYNNHTHNVPGIMSGSSTAVSATPTVPMTDVHLTSKVKAN